MRKTAINTLFALAFAAVTAAGLVSCGGSEKNDTPISMSMPLLTSAAMHGEGVGWNRADCTTCHPLVSLPTPHPVIPEINDMTRDEVCMMCHLGNGADGRFKIPMCVKCHTDASVFGADAVNVTGYSMHTVTNTGAAQITDYDCIVCHDSTNMDGKFTFDDLSGLMNLSNYGNTVWDKSNLNNFCFTCHSSSGTKAQGIYILGYNAKDKYPDDYHGNATYYSTDNSLRPDNGVGDTLGCLSCHRRHTSDNRKLFIMTGAETGVVTDESARNATVTLNIDNADLRDLCAVCHAGDPAQHPDSVPAPNGLYQVSKHTDSVCYTCHVNGGMRPPVSYPLGANLAASMMSSGDSCNACHKHGANMGPSSTQYPIGTTHSRF